VTRGRKRGADLFGELPALPGGLVYVESFLSGAEEQALLARIAELPLHEAKYREYTAKRRIASFGREYDFSHRKLLPGAPLPDFLLPLRDKVAAWQRVPAAEFHHALVTEYRPGTALGWHRDTPEFGIVVGISLANPARMRLRPYPPKKGRDPRALALELAPRSAYVFRDDARWGWQHSIPPTTALRYSITLRTLNTRAAK
jgi:alkylated DNA repair dioxygenase AlkB